jgi:hypothetical protein
MCCPAHLTAPGRTLRIWRGRFGVAGTTGIGASFSLTAAFLAAAVDPFGGFLRFAAATFVGLWGASFPGGFCTALLRLFGIFEFMAEEKHIVGKWYSCLYMHVLYTVP